jgi:hypothetical protein
MPHRMKLPRMFRVNKATDETADKSHIGERGKLINVDYSCGCGQSQGDGMYLLEFPNGKTEEFWHEEIMEICVYCNGKGYTPAYSPGYITAVAKSFCNFCIDGIPKAWLEPGGKTR